jgi:hypothetical protein
VRDGDRTEGRSALIVVRAGALDRFAALESAFGPEGVGVVWDRRVGERRRPAGESRLGAERRRLDRRGPAPLSWTLLDFLVVPGVPLAS